jgi:hypothetical protein
MLDLYHLHLSCSLIDDCHKLKEINANDLLRGVLLNITCVKIK